MATTAKISRKDLGALHALATAPLTLEERCRAAERIGTRCLAITTGLSAFLYSGQPVPRPQNRELSDDFAWARWMLKGKPRDKHRTEPTIEERKLLEIAFARLKNPPRRARKLFYPEGRRRGRAWQRRMAKELLVFFERLHDFAIFEDARSIGVW